MITPFDRNFKLQEYEIVPDIIQTGYINLLFIPDLSTVSVDLDEAFSILSNAYIVEEVTTNNLFSYPTAEIGKYVLSWNISDSSSSSIDLLELKILIESGNYFWIQIRYISSE